jgi:hypothetical protein
LCLTIAAHARLVAGGDRVDQVGVDADPHAVIVRGGTVIVEARRRGVEVP